MTRYLHEGGDVSCGGPECLAVLASREQELAEKKEREEQERKEQELIQKMNEEDLIKSQETNEKIIKEIKTEKNKSYFNKLFNKVLGTTKESCLKKEVALEKGGDMARATMIGSCVAAGIGGFANIPADIGCGVSVGVTVATDYACDSWKNHCNTLPSNDMTTITTKPN